ncbi:MAG: NAD(P)-binding protein, partial [Calditrichaceae bacterium]
MNKYDHVVIGSGVSGLTTALILGKFGKKVALLEQHSNTAPLIRRFKRNKSWCDPGFHYTGGLNPSGSLSILFRYLGLADHIEAMPMDYNGFDILSLKGQGEYKMPYGLDNLKEYLCTHFPNSVKAINNFIQKIKDINCNTAFINPDMPFTEFSSEIYLNHSLDSYLRSIGAEQELIDLLGCHGYVLYGSNAAEVPLHTYAYIMGSFYESASLVVDGGNGIVSAFEKQLKKYDISVFTDCTVCGFNIENGKTLKGVYCEDEQCFECDSCISTIHPKLLISMLKDASVRPAYVNRIKKLENTIAAVVVFLESDDYPEEVLKTNYYEFDLKSSYDNQLDYTAYMSVNPDAETRGKRAFTVIKSVSLEAFKPYFGS